LKRSSAGKEGKKGNEMAYSGNIDADRYDMERDPIMVICPECKGMGEVHLGNCSSCGGSGLDTIDNGVQLDEPCPQCMGEGDGIIDCPYCGGEGEVEKGVAEIFVEPIEYDEEENDE
jgi:DnaJ-class molecular chaperone